MHMYIQTHTYIPLDTCTYPYMHMHCRASKACNAVFDLAF